jgi:hypothetical protein
MGSRDDSVFFRKHALLLLLLSENQPLPVARKEQPQLGY